MAELVTLDPVTLGGLRRRFAFDERLSKIPSAFDALGGLQREAGLLACGPETALYRVEGDEIEVTVGVPMDVMLPGFEAIEVPGSRALMHRLRGPFSGLPQVYPALHAAAAEQGLTPTGLAREVYRIIARNDAHNVCDVYLDVE
ncbi:GyrI-like domain-containing protein [uncultured Tateyamaria sp.]|uniref:GyrI-like domain-containing protein n=1 Tax=Tateyamaria sp. 1078 TaxID=3417464 RepID=UPI002609266B|nr:GyrI-like domain-containing protein [uncultured Tateyamaria sp.]